jgi:hypothetical protein
MARQDLIRTRVARFAQHNRQEEKIEDEAELAQVQRQARKVMIKAVLAGAALTLIAVALPV